MNARIAHRTLFKLAATVLMIMSAVFVAISTPSPASAAANTVCQCTNTYSDGTIKVEEGTKSAVLGDSNGCYCKGITGVLEIIINVFTVGIGIFAVIGIVWAGILYLTSRDNENQVAMAKRRIQQIVIGIIAFVLSGALVNFLLPGGGLNNTPAIISSTSAYVNQSDSTASPNSSGSSSSTSPSTPSVPSDTTGSTTPSVPSGNSCADYGVAEGAVYYTQYGSSKDIIWKGGSYPNSTIGESGCPMIAILNAANKVTNCKLTPQMLADRMKAYTNNFTNRRGLFADSSTWNNYGEAIIKYYAGVYNVKIKSISRSRVKEALRAGHAVIVRGARGDNDSNKVFSRNGHYVSFVGITGNTITVKNPASSSYGSVSFEDATKHATNYWEIEK